MTLNESLLRAYEATNYVVHAAAHKIVLRIQEPSPELKSLFQLYGKSAAAFITAYNPFSHQTSEEDNRRAQACLRRDLEAASIVILDGYGQGTIGDWPPEPSFLAIGIDRQEAEVLGRRYKQNAIVWIGDDGVPALVPLDRCEPMRSIPASGQSMRP